MNARALQESSVDPMDAAMMSEDPDTVGNGSMAVLTTMLAIVAVAVSTIIAVVLMVRRSRSRSSVAALPKKAVDSLQHAVTKLTDLAA